MKKILVLFFVAMTAMAVNAQVYIGGSVGFWHNDDADKTVFELSPEIGYEINNQWSVGAVLSISHAKIKKDEVKIKANAFAFAPYARYTFLNTKMINLFIDGGIGLSTYKVKGFDSEAGFEIGLKPGLAIKLNKNFSLVTKYGFLGYRDDYMGKGENGYGFALSSEDLSIGFHYIF